MPIEKVSFDMTIFSKHLWKSIYNIMKKNNFSLDNMVQKFWKSKPYISDLLNWKRATKNLDVYLNLTIAAGWNQAEFDQIVENAKTYEYEQTTWKKVQNEISTLDNLKIEDLTLEDIREAMADNTLFSKGGKISDNEALDEVIKYAMEKWDMELMKRVIKKN